MPALSFRKVNKKYEIKQLSTGEARLFTPAELRALVDQILHGKKAAFGFYHYPEIFQFVESEKLLPDSKMKFPTMSPSMTEHLRKELKKIVTREQMLYVYSTYERIIEEFQKFLTTNRTKEDLQNLYKIYGQMTEQEWIFLTSKVVKLAEDLYGIVDEGEALRASPFYDNWRRDGIHSDSVFYYLGRVFEKLDSGKTDIDKDIAAITKFNLLSKLKQIAQSW